MEDKSSQSQETPTTGSAPLKLNTSWTSLAVNRTKLVNYLKSSSERKRPKLQIPFRSYASEPHTSTDGKRDVKSDPDATLACEDTITKARQQQLRFHKDTTGHTRCDHVGQSDVDNCSIESEQLKDDCPDGHCKGHGGLDVKGTKEVADMTCQMKQSHRTSDTDGSDECSNRDKHAIRKPSIAKQSRSASADNCANCDCNSIKLSPTGISKGVQTLGPDSNSGSGCFAGKATDINDAAHPVTVCNTEPGTVVQVTVFDQPCRPVGRVECNECNMSVTRLSSGVKHKHEVCKRQASGSTTTKHHEPSLCLPESVKATVYDRDLCRQKACENEAYKRQACGSTTANQYVSCDPPLCLPESVKSTVSDRRMSSCGHLSSGVKREHETCKRQASGSTTAKQHDTCDTPLCLPESIKSTVNDRRMSSSGHLSLGLAGERRIMTCGEGFGDLPVLDDGSSTKRSLNGNVARKWDCFVSVADSVKIFMRKSGDGQ